jgi:short-subunit dehydrogenase
MTQRQLSGLRCLVTGCSSGIGQELVRQLIAAKAEVVGVARREERLRELAAELNAGRQFQFIAGDVTHAEIRQQALALCEQSWGGLDLLINNAGVGALGPFADADEARLRRVFEVNFFAPAEWTRASLPLLRKGRTPAIVNISSVLGHRAVPGKSEYCASKFALHGWSDALRAELASEQVDVILVSPSTTASEFFDVAEGTRSAPKVGSQPMSAAAVARCTLAAIRWGKHEVILTWGGKFLVWLDRLCPPLANYLVARLG